MKQRSKRAQNAVAERETRADRQQGPQKGGGHGTQTAVSHRRGTDLGCSPWAASGATSLPVLHTLRADDDADSSRHLQTPAPRTWLLLAPLPLPSPPPSRPRSNPLSPCLVTAGDAHTLACTMPAALGLHPPPEASTIPGSPRAEASRLTHNL